MDMKVLATSAVLVSMASGAMAQSLDPVRIEMFRSILAGNECTLTEAAAANILPRFNFTREETRGIVGALVAAGEVRLDGSTLNLVDGSCAVEDPVVALLERRDVQQFIAVMAEYSCTMHEADAEEIFAVRGLNKAQVGAVIGPMIGAGMARFEAGILSVDSAYCSAPVVETTVDTPVEVPTPLAPINDDTPLAAFISVAAQNSCTVDVSAAAGPLAAVDLRMDQAYRIVDDLMASGKASLINGGAMVILDPSICGGAAQPVEPVQTPVTPGVTTPVQATADSTDPRADILTMLAANGCEVTQANVTERVMAAGLDLNETLRVLTQMMASGEATSPDSGQTLQVGAPLCVAAGVELMTPREAFINLIKQNNCSITAAEFSTMLPVDGLDANTAFGMINELEAEGVISLPATRDVVTLSAEMCQ